MINLVKRCFLWYMSDKSWEYYLNTADLAPFEIGQKSFLNEDLFHHFQSFIHNNIQGTNLILCKSYLLDMYRTLIYSISYEISLNPSPPFCDRINRALQSWLCGRGEPAD